MKPCIIILIACLSILAAACKEESDKSEQNNSLADKTIQQNDTKSDESAEKKDSKFGSFTDSRDGNTYRTVKIGDQEWMAENLAYLPDVSPSSSGSDSKVYYYVYGYEGTNVGEATSTDNYKTYGALYNWPAAMNSCPSGWHLPGDDEWKELETFLGMSQSEADKEEWRGTDEGGKLKETDTAHWESPNIGATNESGFTALPGGYRYGSDFSFAGNFGFWWSSSESSIATAWSRSVFDIYSNVCRYDNLVEHGLSVRCLRD